MPLLNFTKLLPKLLDKSKLQTIRKPRKVPLRVGDLLYVYWKCRTPAAHKLGEARITSMVQKRFCEITAWDFLKDGFRPENMTPDLAEAFQASYLGALMAGGLQVSIRILTDAVTAFAEMHPELRTLAGWNEPFDIITFEWVSGPVAPPEYHWGMDYAEPDTHSRLEASTK